MLTLTTMHCLHFIVIFHYPIPLLETKKQSKSKIQSDILSVHNSEMVTNDLNKALSKMDFSIGISLWIKDLDAYLVGEGKYQDIKLKMGIICWMFLSNI